MPRAGWRRPRSVGQRPPTAPSRAPPVSPRTLHGAQAGPAGPPRQGASRDGHAEPSHDEEGRPLPTCLPATVTETHALRSSAALAWESSHRVLHLLWSPDAMRGAEGGTPLAPHHPPGHRPERAAPASGRLRGTEVAPGGPGPPVGAGREEREERRGGGRLPAEGPGGAGRPAPRGSPC